VHTYVRVCAHGCFVFNPTVFFFHPEIRLLGFRYIRAFRSDWWVGALYGNTTEQRFKYLLARIHKLHACVCVTVCVCICECMCECVDTYACVCARECVRAFVLSVCMSACVCVCARVRACNALVVLTVIEMKWVDSE